MLRHAGDFTPVAEVGGALVESDESDLLADLIRQRLAGTASLSRDVADIVERSLGER